MAVVDGGNEGRIDGAEGRSVEVLGKFAFGNVFTVTAGMAVKYAHTLLMDTITG